MKIISPFTLYLLGLLLGLACLQYTLATKADAGYKLVNSWEDDDNSLHYVVNYAGRDENFELNHRKSPIVKELHMIVSFPDENSFRIKILNNEITRWEIPEKSPFPHFTSNNLLSATHGCVTVKVQEEPFSFYVERNDNQEILFDTRGKKFIYSEFYIELSSSLPTTNVYGYGERNYKFKLAPGIYTIWGRDDPKILEDGKGGKNTYGHHPVGLIRDITGNFFMSFMRNSNAMDVIINEEPGITYKMVGGVIDLVFFVGDSYPENVIKNYHNYIGNFTMMPFWSLGYHQSKWGYDKHEKMEDVVAKYIKHDIPLDVIWSDIDYMINKEIFTIDERRYPLEKMRELTTKYKKKWVPIIDPGVKVEDAQGPGLDYGLKMDIFIKSAKGGNLMGSVWPGRTFFPDFFHPDSDKYWCDMLDVLYEKVPFAGIWLDMNEVANFVDGEERRWDSNKYDLIPYTPGERPLKKKTLSMDATHHGGMVEYDVHSLYAIMENQATHKFLQTKSKLPFILTRASSVGLGRFSAHWTGDNGAYWEYLKHSIPGNFNFQIFGIPFVGADICGFMDDTNEELCARWTQLGALYPFARNHHELQSRSQEPWMFNPNSHMSVLETTKIALKTRYSILKWYYSLFIETRGAGSIFKPLMFEFPNEETLYQDGFSDWEFLLGKGVLCTPKVEQGEPFVHAYFPKANWFDLFNGTKVMSKGDTERTQRVETPYKAPVPLFLRGGHIVHRQNVDNVLSTEDLNDEFELIVALEKETESEKLTAKGSIMGIETFDDDSVHSRCMTNNCMYDIIVTVRNIEKSSASIEIKFNRQNEKEDILLDDLGLYGLRLYGLPLQFMGEDESKVGFALGQLYGTGNGPATFSGLNDMFYLANDAFQIKFDDVIRVQDGDTLILELII